MNRAILPLLIAVALATGCGREDGQTKDAAPAEVSNEFTEIIKRAGNQIDDMNAKEDALQKSLKADPQPIFDLAKKAVKEGLAEHAGDDSANAATITVDKQSLKTFGPRKWTVRGHLSAADKDGQPRETTWEATTSIFAGRLQVTRTSLEVR